MGNHTFRIGSTFKFEAWNSQLLRQQFRFRWRHCCVCVSGKKKVCNRVSPRKQRALGCVYGKNLWFVPWLYTTILGGYFFRTFAKALHWSKKTHLWETKRKKKQGLGSVWKKHMSGTPGDWRILWLSINAMIANDWYCRNRQIYNVHVGPQQPMEKMKVLGPQFMGELTQKNEGFGFPWYIIYNVHVCLFNRSSDLQTKKQLKNHAKFVSESKRNQNPDAPCMDVPALGENWWHSSEHVYHEPLQNHEKPRVLAHRFRHLERKTQVIYHRKPPNM